MQQDILEKFTIHLRNTLSRSIDLAWELQQEFIPPSFLLLGLSEQIGSGASEILKRSKITSEIIAEHIDKELSTTISPEKIKDMEAPVNEPKLFLWPEFTPLTKKLIERAAVLAFENKHQYIGTEHLLMSIVNYPDSDIASITTTAKSSLEELKKNLTSAFKSTSKYSSIQSLFSSETQNAAQPSPGDGQAANQATQGLPNQDTSDTPALDYFGLDLTSEEQIRKIDPVIGRSAEIDRLIHILSRRTKNNPVLIGDPGVGKTAIVEGLARRIKEDDVPDVLLHKRLIGLDLSLVLAGTMYRGEFESRLKQIIDEIKANPDIIIFIDEIHTLVGAGSVQSGNMDAANILKPALAKGDINCIGATTSEEYRKHIEKDAALDRRFQPIAVAEPTEEEAIEILQGLRDYYEKFHHIEISDEVIRAAVSLSNRYIPERKLPDKAIDLIDEAGAKVRVKRNVPKVLKQFEKFSRLLSDLKKRKEEAVRSEQFGLAVDLKDKEKVLIDKITELRRKVKALDIPAINLTTDDIADVVSVSTGIPQAHITASGKQRHKKIKSEIGQRIFGQDEAVGQVTAVLKRSFAGLSSPDRPLGSFMFLGPSGVGKTELAKTLALTQFGDIKSLIRVDMSEFSESFTVSKLIGAPAGYVGYNEQVQLGDQIRKRPYSVVLFDEIEKAHPDIFNLLLQIIDEGRLTDSNGRELNFRNSVIIMTSNIGIEMLNQQAAIGFVNEDEDKGEGAKKDNKPGDQTTPDFDEVKETLLTELKSYFPTEFLSRIDHQIVFEPLTPVVLQNIVDLHFTDVQNRLQEHGVKAMLNKTAKKFIAEKSFSPDQGARMVRKTITDLIENKLADMLLSSKLTSKDTIKIGVKNDSIHIAKAKNK